MTVGRDAIANPEGGVWIPAFAGMTIRCAAGMTIGCGGGNDDMMLMGGNGDIVEAGMAI